MERVRVTDVSMQPAGARRTGRLVSEAWLARLGLLAVASFLAISVALPLYALLSKSVEDENKAYVGLANFVRFFDEPGLAVSVTNSIKVSFAAATITIVLAFLFSHALTRTAMPFKGLLKGAAMIPLLAPSLLPAIALIYYFGKQGVARVLLFGNDIYGPIGIVIGEVLYSFPHAVLMISTALATADQRLYDAAVSLKASPWRIFWSVTLPGCRYGLISAYLAVFTLIFTDFGVPSVVGGSYPVLATEIYKQVVGRFDFEMGAVVGVFLLLPAVFSFTVDRLIQQRQSAMVTAAAVPLTIKPNRWRDGLALAFAAAIGLVMIAVIGMAAFASFIKFWPYNLTLTLKNYNFPAIDSTGWYVYTNTLLLAASTACVGAAIVFLGAYLIEKTRQDAVLRNFTQLLCMLPLAVPGIVLGLAYIFFFNNPGNPLHFTYGTMTILVLCTIAHFYTVPHMTALTALKQLDREFESVGASLRVPFHVTLRRVTIPVCLPALLDIWVYLFINAATTVSAVVFLYSAQTKLASITIVHWNDSGRLAPAAALGTVLFATSCGVWLLQAVLSRGLLKRTQAWRRRNQD
ncbi:MAG: putative 2-aminoethylphosphonate ABC transporter permease subunit [Alphaproteobacteria bacterium]|nr:putative 2-aminoethylphosphonate ABC transporter permease subunit [Alphaproteobacteria bacterium]